MGWEEREGFGRASTAEISDRVEALRVMPDAPAEEGRKSRKMIGEFRG
jgi:hypothetical protein